MNSMPRIPESPLTSWDGEQAKNTSDRSLDPTVLVLGSAVSVTLGCLVDFAAESMLALVVCALAVLLWPRTRMTESMRMAGLLFLALAMGTAGVKDDFGRLLDGKVRVWNVYHYFLGAKYFPELGYQDLYVATLAADRQHAGVFEPHVEKIRSLHTYKVRRLTDEDLAYDPSAHFTPARWSEFQGDVEALGVHRSPRGWRNVFRDRGYNGTPLWTALGRALTYWIPADSAGLLVLASLDLLLLAGTSIFFVRTFGGQVSVAVLLLFVASPTNVARLAGGFLQTDWLCAAVIGACLLHRNRHGSAAVALGYATLTRVFPVLLVAAALAPTALRLASQRSLTLPSKWRRFVVTFAVTCLLGVAVGAAGNGRGLAGWTEFADSISLHRTTHVIGDRRIGLQHAFTRSWTEITDHTSDDDRVDHLASQRGGYLVSAVLLLGLCLPVLRKAQAPGALALGMIPVFALTVVSRYYFGLLALLPLLTPQRRWPVAAQLVPFVAYYTIAQTSADQHTAYVLLNGLLALYFLVLLVALGLRAPQPRPASPERAREVPITP